PTPTTLAVINMDPLKGNAVLEIAPEITFIMIDRLFGGSGDTGGKVNRDLTDIEQSVMEGIIVRILANMREAWTQVIDLRPRLQQIETNPQFAQIVPPTEMVILVTLEIKIGEEAGMMNICIPYITIEPIISKLSSQFWFSSVRRSSTTQYLGTLKEKLSDVEMELIAEVGSMNVPIRDVLNLHIGDVIRFNTTKITDPLILSVGSQKKFYCQPGVVGKKRAVQIIEKIKENDEDEFEELTAEGEETL
ncbi:MAG: flagellar motor switch protein FliM, partial [Treponema sp.]|nr:flagellar motor switch protein FliM [Treponema sp.]